jgi:hypothetical protein
MKLVQADLREDADRFICVTVLQQQAFVHVIEQPVLEAVKRIPVTTVVQAVHRFFFIKMIAALVDVIKELNIFPVMRVIHAVCKQLVVANIFFLHIGNHSIQYIHPLKIIIPVE